MTPCLDEDWFVDDWLELMRGDSKIEETALRFGNDPEEGLRKMYRMARTHRCNLIMSGKMDEARKIGNDYIFELMETIESMVLLAVMVHMDKGKADD